ncbi:MAG: fimbrillin family protein [Prolixibacteraceae bacterium]|nr:fimbrillin family protein [Prolixibacteraceae bacterium]
MKKLLLITLSVTALAVTALLSCTKDQDLNPENQNVALSVKAGIMVDPSIMTKSIIIGSAFDPEAEIGVQVLKDASIYQDGALTNIKYTKGDTWTTITPFYLTSAEGNIYAYYPYVDVASNDALFNTIPVTITPEITTGAETDYMYATPATVNNAAPSIDLVMNHALAQVSFIVYKTNYSGTGTFTKFIIEDAGSTEFIKTGTDLTMNITNGTIGGGAVGSLTRTLAPSVTLSATLPTVVNATTLTIPTTEISSLGLKFTFTIDGVDYSTTNSAAITLEKGKQYIYTINLEGTELQISDPFITDWSPVTKDALTIN